MVKIIQNQTEDSIEKIEIMYDFFSKLLVCDFLTTLFYIITLKNGLSYLKFIDNSMIALVLKMSLITKCHNLSESSELNYSFSS